MILIKATFVEDYNGLTIAKSDVSERYDVYAEHGFVFGGFNSLHVAKEAIDGEDIIGINGLNLKKQDGVWNYWHDEIYGWCCPVPYEVIDQVKALGHD